MRLDRQGCGAAGDAFYTFVYSPLRDASRQVEQVIVSRRRCQKPVEPEALVDLVDRLAVRPDADDPPPARAVRSDVLSNFARTLR